MKTVLHHLFIELKQLNIVCHEDMLLKDYTTLHIGGRASLLVEPKTIEELQECLYKINQYSLPYEILGKGSNVLISDLGFQGVMIVLSTYFQMMKMMDSMHIYVYSGTLLKDLCDFACLQGLTGIEFACGIPGSVGGAIVMNAGAYGGEMKDIVSKVDYIDQEGQIQTLMIEELDFGYRKSYFVENKGIIIGVEIQLEKGNKDDIRSKMNELMIQRYEKQPMDQYSAGSTFKRPEGQFASALIKDAKLQGLRRGGASVSKKHAGFLINDNHATYQDFVDLIKEVQERVYQHSGYFLECEIKMIE